MAKRSIVELHPIHLVRSDVFTVYAGALGAPDAVFRERVGDNCVLEEVPEDEYVVVDVTVNGDAFRVVRFGCSQHSSYLDSGAPVRIFALRSGA